MGCLELRSRSQDATEGPASEAYIQHWFQEEFLRLFYDDPEFREQVLKCLLTGDDDANAEMRKPRRIHFTQSMHKIPLRASEFRAGGKASQRTWFNGMSKAQEMSCEEARYLHLCGENTSTDSDMSEAADEKRHVVLKTNFATYEPIHQHLGQKQTAASLEPVSEDLFPSKKFNTNDSDKNQPGILTGGNSNVSYHCPGAGIVTVTAGPDSPEDRLASPFPSAVASERQDKSLDESPTGPCVHERGTQTWKANPLYLHSNSDSDSDDSWQHGGSTVAWMDDLENGRMLQEVKMRKVKRLEESRPSRKAEGCNNWREHFKCGHKISLSSNIQGLPSHFTKDSKAGHSQVKKNLDEEGTKDLSTETLCGASTSFLCVMSKQIEQMTVTSEKNSKDSLASEDKKSANLPIVREHRETVPSCFSVHADELGDFILSSASAENKRLDQDLLRKFPLVIVSQDLPSVVSQEDEKALLQHIFPKVTLPEHNLNGEVMLPSGCLSGTQEFVVYENEKPKTLLESISPAEERLRLEEELISPLSNMHSSALLDQLNGNNEETLPLASSCRAPITNLDTQFTSRSGAISCPPHCTLDAQSERESPSGSICGSTKSLTKCSVSQGKLQFLFNREYDMSRPEAGEVILNERNKGVDEEIGSSIVPNSTSLDEGERPALVGPQQESICGSISGEEMASSFIICGGMLSEEKVPSPLPPRSLRTSRLAVTYEEVDPPKPTHESFSRSLPRRVAFQAAKDIHWLPPKRNIQSWGFKGQGRILHHKM